ncbi:MAG: hypothetical protein EOM24_24900 [Chloroflexia bacterium]|nr:hypothetical protein [Chloroflexia bacterium]
MSHAAGITRAEKTESLYICIKKGIVNWSRLRAGGDALEVFVRPEGSAQSDEHTLWFKYVSVTRDPADEPDVLTTVKVSSRLREHTLSFSSHQHPKTCAMQRRFTDALLPVLIRPASPVSSRTDAPDQARLERWGAHSRIEVRVREDRLGRKKASSTLGEPNRLHDNMHAASVTGVAVLVYSVLWAIRERLRANNEVPRMLILRAQTQGRDAARGDDGLPACVGLSRNLGKHKKPFA